MKRVLLCIFICFSVIRCQTISTVNTNRVEGIYLSNIPGKNNNWMSYGVRFNTDKTAILAISENKQTKVFHGNWLKTKDNIIILYFSNHIPESEFFKQNIDGDLMILKRNKQPFDGKLAKHMILHKFNIHKKTGASKTAE